MWGRGGLVGILGVLAGDALVPADAREQALHGTQAHEHQQAKATVTAAPVEKPMPTARPTEAVSHRLAAVVSPWMEVPWRRMAHASEEADPDDDLAGDAGDVRADDGRLRAGTACPAEMLDQGEEAGAEATMRCVRSPAACPSSALQPEQPAQEQGQRQPQR